MTALEAAVEVLRKEGKSLHIEEITERMLESGLWQSKAKTPRNTVNTRISDDISLKGERSRFRRMEPGVYGLNEHRVPTPTTKPVVTEPKATEPKLSYTDAAERILRENYGQEPLHCREITQRIIDLGLVATKSKTPSHTLSASIGEEIRRRDKSNQPQRFVRLGQGRIGLADAESDRSPKPSVDENQTAEGSSQPQAAPEPKLSYTNAAEQILRQNDGQEPLHYREIARRLLDLGLVATKAVTPAHTLSAAIGDEIRRRQEANQPQRFVRLGRGLIGLADAEPEGVRKAIDDENGRVREALLDFLRSTDPVEFEHLVGELFNAMGAESVTVTRGSGDGGVDVRGTLLAGGAIPIQIAAQVKRWKHNVGSPVVNEIRGSLGLHDIGLVVTTGRFSIGAKKAAQIKDRKPITLIDGDDLVNLMVEHEIWVNRQQHDLLTLATPSPDRTKGSA